MENLNDLVIFVKVVEAGGFSSAAGALRMSPGLVSRRLRHLEEELGVQLVNRSTRHIGLTEAGEAFYKECARALAAIDAARSAAVGLSDEPRGTLKVHAAVGVGQSLVADAAIAFKQAYPDMTIDLHVGSHRVNLLKDGYDVVFKTSTVTDSSLECREFGYIRHVIVAAPDYLRRAGTPHAPEELQHHECLIQYGRRPPTDWYFLGPQGSYAVRVAGSFRSSSAVTLSTAAARGLGIAHVPEYVLYGHRHEGDLQVVFDDCVAPQRLLKAYYPRSRHLPAKVQAFLDCLDLVDAHRSVFTAGPRKRGLA